MEAQEIITIIGVVIGAVASCFLGITRIYAENKRKKKRKKNLTKLINDD